MKTTPAAGPWETGRPKHAAESEIDCCTHTDDVVSGETEDNRCVWRMCEKRAAWRRYLHAIFLLRVNTEIVIICSTNKQRRGLR